MGRSPVSPRDRDAGLDRVSKITTWTVAVALAATGFFAGLAAEVGRGTTSTAAKASARASARHRAAVARQNRGDDAGTGENGWGATSPTVPQPQQPTVVPAPSQSSNGFAPIVSGAS